MDLLSPKVRSIVRIGSSTWAKNYNVRNALFDKSDLDIEVLIDNVSTSLGEGLPGAEEGLDAFLELFKNGEADYYSYGFKSNGIPISIHFMPTNTFIRNCNLDCLSLSKIQSNIEFRTKPKSKPPIYDERYDGQGNEFVFHASPKKTESGILTEVPVMMIGDRDQIVMGLIMSKYFTSPMVYGNHTFFESNIAKFKSNLNLRLIAEGGGSFSKMPARKEIMPCYVLEQLDLEQEKLQIKKIKILTKYVKTYFEN